MKQLLLCTDLDRTLIPNGVQPVSPEAKPRFCQLVKRDEVMLVYVTGRDAALVKQAIFEFDLPQPDFVIADVGSTIYQVESENWLQLDEWDEQITPDWLGLSHDNINLTLRVFSGLRLQEKEKQKRHKLSFYVPLNKNSQILIKKIGVQLKFSGIKANLIWSIDEKARIGLLDILPASANKLHAIHFLMQRCGFHHRNTVFAGDSGNDLDVLLSDIPAVLVANADKEVKDSAASANPKMLYIAHGDYMGMNGNYSAGILEGAAHYWPEVSTWLSEMNTEENN